MLAALMDDRLRAVRTFRFWLGHLLIADAVFDWAIVLILLARSRPRELWEVLIIGWPAGAALIAFGLFGRENARRVRDDG